MMTVAHGPDSALVAVGSLDAELRPFPRYECFQCNGKVTAVLPPTRGRRPHFRHKVAGVCSASRKGEGPLHLDAKLKLVARLQEMAARDEPVRIAELCPGGCNVVFLYRYIALRQGDVVKCEHALDPRRPDVAVLRDDKVIAAFEIAVTHYCDAVKWADMRKLGVPTVEVEAFDIVGVENSAPAWQPPDPMPAFCVEPQPPTTLCEDCAERDRREREEAERHSLREMERIASERREREREELAAASSWRAVATLRVFAANEYLFVISRSEHRGRVLGRIVDANGLIWGRASGMIAADVGWMIGDLRDRALAALRRPGDPEPSRVLEVIDPPGKMSEADAFNARK
jgi:hypothetical protein